MRDVFLPAVQAVRLPFSGLSFVPCFLAGRVVGAAPFSVVSCPPHSFLAIARIVREKKFLVSEQ